MRCTTAVQQLHFYIDKQLTLAQIRALETHLATCASCRKELFLLEEIACSLQAIDPVVEPADLTVNVMRRVVLTTQQLEKATPRVQQEPIYTFLRPSLTELFFVVLLATITTLGVILGQPALRETLPFANGHDVLSLMFIQVIHDLSNVNASTAMLLFWVLGTLLGVWITLALAGNEMRNEWFRAVMDRLPVW